MSVVPFTSIAELMHSSGSGSSLRATVPSCSIIVRHPPLSKKLVLILERGSNFIEAPTNVEHQDDERRLNFPIVHPAFVAEILAVRYN